MTAAVLYGKEQLQIEIVDVPKLGPGDVLVRVRAALTCGTDVKVFRRGYHARMITPPALFGHELAGDIVAMGDQVKGFRIGQRVMAANSAPCGECYYCKRQQENLCTDLLFNNGAYAEYIRIPERIVRKNLHLLEDHVGYQDAALGGAAGLRAARVGREQCSSRRYGGGDRARSDRDYVRAFGEGGLRCACDRYRTPPAATGSRGPHGRR